MTNFKNYCNKIIKGIPVLKNKPASQIAEVLFTDEDAESFAQFLNDIGLLLFFPEIKLIRDKVFLNQKQIIGYIHKVLQGLGKLQGEFTFEKVKKDLTKAAKDKTISNSDVSDIVSLMLHFKIIFQHPAKSDTYIAPLYLPKEPLQSIKIFSSLFHKPAFRFEYNAFIHKNVILDFFHHYGKHALNEDSNANLYYYWKDGLIIKDETSAEIVMVRFHEPSKSNHCAYIDVFSLQLTMDKSFLDKIVNDLDIINEGWGAEKTVSNDGENFVPLEEILKNEFEGNLIFIYKGRVYNLTDFSKYLKKKLKMKKVFVSYSKSDAAHLIKLENHLSVLKRNGTISTWNCRKLLPGEKWDGKIKKELEDADLILFLVSDDFLATDYIWDVEIKRAIERDNDLNDSVHVVPIIVRACDWEDSPLGIYNTAPKKAEVIKSAEDIDEAWTRVVKELKAIL